MKSAKLIIGILSILLSLFIFFQSFFAGLSNAMTDNGETSGSFGVIVGICFLIAGITGIVVRKGGKGGFAAASFYIAGGLLGLIGAGSYGDLTIWSWLSLIFGVVFIIGSFNKKKNIHSSNEMSMYRSHRSDDKLLYQKWYFIVPIVTLLVSITAYFVNFNGLKTSSTNAIGSSEMTSIESNTDEDELQLLSIGDSATVDGLKITITDAVVNNERNQFADTVDNVITIYYVLENTSNEDQPFGTELSLFVDGKQAETYPLDNSLGSISSGRRVDAEQSFGFNDDILNLEVEFKPTLTLSNEKAIYKIEIKEGNLSPSTKKKNDESSATTAKKEKTTADKKTKVESESNKPSNSTSNAQSSSDTSRQDEITYWNSLASQYGFQAYNGFGSFEQFKESAQQLIYNAETYGNPYGGPEYYQEPASEVVEYPELEGYIEDQDGNLWENPVYDNRWGPEDDPTNQVVPEESFDPQTYSGW